MIESVAVRQRGGTDFATHYENLCALQSSCPLPAVKAHLHEGVIDINADRLKSTDWVPLCNTLKINKSLRMVAVRSSWAPTEEEERKLRKKKPPAIRSRSQTTQLCSALRDCLCVSPSLTCIELEGLPLRDRDLSALAKGMTKNATLQHLSLEYCPIRDAGFETVCKGLKNSQSITSLNVTGCELGPRSADMIAKIIKHHAMMRHNEAWRDSLRYRRPDLDRMDGIRRVTINYNPLVGDQGATLLAEALKDDLWLKALDMQACGLSSEGAKSLLDVLKYNTTVVVLDVRQNPMIDEEVIQSINEQVMINSNGQETEYKWLSAEPMREQNGSAVSSAQARRGKRKLKTLQNSFGRKTTIKVSGGGGTASRRRSKSTGSLHVSPSPGLPWRTALRAGRFRGYPPDAGGSPSKVYENLSTRSLSPGAPGASRSPGGGGWSYVEDDDADSTAESSVNGLDEHIRSTRRIKVELEQTRRRLREETEARARAEERVLELTMENRRLRAEMESAGGASFLGVLADEKVLDSIENAFRQFHSFLDLLREAGLGQLISMAGLDQSQMPFGNKTSNGVGDASGGVGSSLLATSMLASRQNGSVSVTYPERDSSNALPTHEVSRRLEELRAPSTTSAVTATHVVPQNYVTSHDPVMTSHNPGMASAGLLPGPAVGMGEPREQLQDPTMAGGGVVEPLPHLQRSGNKFDDLYEKVLQETEQTLSDYRDTAEGRMRDARAAQRERNLRTALGAGDLDSGGGKPGASENGAKSSVDGDWKSNGENGLKSSGGSGGKSLSRSENGAKSNGDSLNGIKSGRSERSGRSAGKGGEDPGSHSSQRGRSQQQRSLGNHSSSSNHSQSEADVTKQPPIPTPRQLPRDKPSGQSQQPLSASAQLVTSSPRIHQSGSSFEREYSSDSFEKTASEVSEDIAGGSGEALSGGRGNISDDSF